MKTLILAMMMLGCNRMEGGVGQPCRSEDMSCLPGLYCLMYESNPYSSSEVKLVCVNPDHTRIVRDANGYTRNIWCAAKGE